ncbi:MAG: fumarylacetoacetate hydrolase family protein [Rhodospirillaceae bacterium]|nr:2-keto-4-pentenoate hydratase [Rhodospirillaceae bacterium]RPF96512.1 MAG: fumarylacetoacetate hydrolase family protein [Rhodospirillaceae bacterium TMED63]RZO38780.1 MAG: fumarylacetoacetate hydrolase family protein [Rhodospirillaceae bacterium]
MASYRLLNYAGVAGEPRPGILVGDSVVDLEGAGIAGSTYELLQNWGENDPLLSALADDAAAQGSRPLADVKLLAPILYPPVVYNAAANYVDHQKEMSGGKQLVKEDTHPYFFLKAGPHCVIGPEADIRLPAVSDFIDWEAELAVVIGKPARNVKAKDALDYIAGYTIFNDLSARDMKPVGRTFNVHWFAHKNFDGSGPMGPWMVPASDIPDPHDIDIKLWVNDELKQDSNSKYLFFNINEQIEYISARMTMRPGDVIATGTPSGVGAPYGGRLKPGDTVTIEIGGIGRLVNPVVQGD